MGPAKLQRTEHTLVHYFSLEPLLKEFRKLNEQFNNLQSFFINNTLYNKEIENYLKMTKFSQNCILEKIENIRFHESNRTKRGLINGLGYVIKGVTGNLDASDGEKIYKILDHLQNNEKSIESQLKMQYSINNQIIKNFNETIHNIMHNEIILKSRILQLSAFAKDGATHQDILFAKDLYNQLIILYNSILNTLQDIENSITFCKLNTMHPSIIKSKDLFSELQRISIHYKNEMPFEVKYENILDFENIIKINCKIDYNEIIYFLSLPIDYETDFNLYHFVSIPSEYESEFVTITPINKYLLKSKNDDSIKSLSGICTQGKPYHCASLLQTNSNTSCEENVLLHQNTSSCRFNKLQILDNHIEMIPELNQFLAVFPKEEKLELHCKSQMETKELVGIFLIKENSCKIIFRNQQLTFQKTTHGSPMVFDTPKLKITPSDLPKFKIELRKLTFDELPLNPIEPMENTTTKMYFTPSLWTITLYVAFILGIAYFCIRKTKNWSKILATATDVQEENQESGIPLHPRPRINLPGDASF